MKKTSAQILPYFAALLLLAVLAVFPSLAQEKAPTVLRVAFPQTPGFSTTDEYGVRHGLVVDYLNEIAKYTGWEYEYIDVSGEEMIDNFLVGDYDLMGGTYYLPAMEQYCAYPNYSTGQSKSVLLARWDDERISGYNPSDLNGMTIGVHERATENIRRLKEYLSMNGLDCTVKTYRVDQLHNGTLFDYLESGEVDLLLGNAGDDKRQFRSVAYFDAQPHYIVTTAGNQEVLDGLNWAMKQIIESNPNFAAERYTANFPDSGIPSVSLNKDELAYIREKQTVTVALPQDFHPFYCINAPQDIHDGLVSDLLNRVEEFSGLQFEYFYTDTYAQALEAVTSGQADMAGFFLGDNSDALQAGIALTQPYATLSDLVVRNKSVSYPGQGLTCALINGRELPANISAAQVVYFDDIYEALSAVNRGEVDFAYGLSPRIEVELQQHYLSNTVPVSLFNNTNDISFALAKPADARLLTILNKAITNLDQTELDAIVNSNLISTGASSFSYTDLLYANPALVICVIVAVLMLVIAIIILVYHYRMKTVLMRSELEQAEADSRAKSRFLSRMSHEIRTPMNAIVGLTELTGMEQNVPPPVRANLSKLRSSSQYLLRLINDILDMSRIDSGMMTIASEPFSLTQMLDGLQSMIQAEAQRRGQTLLVQTQVTHTVLTGDAIRLRQVLTNLLSNSLKFTPAQGQVELRVQETGSDESAATFLFQVVDNGVGIAKEDQARIFDSFEQLGANSSRSQGTGLGLPISRSIVHLMGGELKLNSQVGSGSEFYFTVTLPYGVLPAEPEMPPRADLLPSARLLLVEDNELNAEIAIELLEIQGAQVTRARDGAQAVRLFADSAPGAFQAVLMDIQMPVMNGLEATRAIRALEHPDAAQVPIVAMTANSFQEDVDAAMAAGMDAFVTKPLDVNYLYSVLQTLIGKK